MKNAGFRHLAANLSLEIVSAAAKSLRPNPLVTEAPNLRAEKKGSLAGGCSKIAIQEAKQLEYG